MTPFWMKASWLPTLLNMLQDIHHLCPIIKDLMKDVSGGYVCKGLPLLHLTLWLLRDMLCRHGFSFSVHQTVVWVTLASVTKIYKQCWKEWLGWWALEGVPHNAISGPRLAYFLVHLFGVGLVWHTICIYCFYYFNLFGTSLSSCGFK